MKDKEGRDPFEIAKGLSVPMRWILLRANNPATHRFWRDKIVAHHKTEAALVARGLAGPPVLKHGLRVGLTITPLGRAVAVALAQGAGR